VPETAEVRIHDVERDLAGIEIGRGHDRSIRAVQNHDSV
jgi:hypothetical protein